MGTYYYYNGDKYTGEWMDDKKCGKGTYFYHNSGDMYEGEWNDNMKNGQGTYKYSNGDVY